MLKSKRQPWIVSPVPLHAFGLGATLQVMAWVVALLSLCLAPIGPAKAAPSSVTYQLGSDLSLQVLADGSLLLVEGKTDQVLLSGSLDDLADSRRRRGQAQDLRGAFFTAREGQDAGQRGFAERADDDGDGRVDEDPLDGLDNDRDGLRDEDFAAISDRMTTLHVEQGHGEGQLEIMHWDGPRLGQALFLKLRATHELGAAHRPAYQLDTRGSAWLETEVACGGHDLLGESLNLTGLALVSRLVRPASGEQDFSAPNSRVAEDRNQVSWLGVMVLNPDRHGPGKRDLDPQLNQQSLRLPLGEESLALVICRAPGWVQLNRLLIDAHRIYAGVTDPVTGQQTRWIVPPLCAHCRLEKTVDFEAFLGPDGQLDLTIRIGPGRSGLLDPDLFLLDGTALGLPETVRWEPTDGPPVQSDWREHHPDRLGAGVVAGSRLFCDLDLEVGHEAAGRLVFSFPNFEGGVSDFLDAKNSHLLQGLWLDGRPFSVTGEVHPAAEVETAGPWAAEAEDSAAAEEDPDRDILWLSPDLLDGFPNPFRERITIEFVVPSTLEETFDWERIERVPVGWDKASPMVWSGGQPSVSVKIYGVNGQELVSLREGSYSPGRYDVSWDGTDAAGRQVASGTYFCKLQLDEFSVTRRLVFLR
ncbi:hypothetical protein CSB20_09660 [bacterium DOLZORAL124_64_63]|nr:MAG: hypothetical protein CSB20_09660 [bacterium DOLZORAL124_64_63]